MQTKTKEKYKFATLRELMEKINPQNQTTPFELDVERSVLGAMLNAPISAVPEVVEVIGTRSEVFYREIHGVIYTAIVSLYESGEAIDLVTVAHKLTGSGKLNEVGGPVYLAGLTDSIVTSANAGTHARILIERFIARELIFICEESKLKAYSKEHDVFQVLEEAEQRIFKLSEEKNINGAESVALVVARIREEQELIREGKKSPYGITTGLIKLDETTRGWKKKELIVLAARPGQGKSALALQCARRAAEANIPVAFFSLEMSSDELTNRLIASVGSFSLSVFQNGKIEESECIRAQNAVAKLPILIRDAPAITPLELRAEARKLKAMFGVGLVVVDYMQLMEAGRNFDSREREISYISRSLKSIAKELDIPVIALSQLNRGVEYRASKVPELSDLRESGAIEQDADKIIFLWRPKMYGMELSPEMRPSENVACLKVAKHRNGEIGENEVAFYPASQLFSNNFPGDAF